jgi:hypothetical protein
MQSHQRPKSTSNIEAKKINYCSNPIWKISIMFQLPKGAFH